MCLLKTFHILTTPLTSHSEPSTPLRKSSRHHNMIFRAIDTMPLFAVFHADIVPQEDGESYPSPASRLGLAEGRVKASK